MKLKVHDPVALREELPKQKLWRGDAGSVFKARPQETHGNEVNGTDYLIAFLPEIGGQNFEIVVDWRRFAPQIPFINPKPVDVFRYIRTQMAQRFFFHPDALPQQAM